MKRYTIFCAIIMGSIILLASFSDDPIPTKVGLGRMLFFDPILSKDKTISCATCHLPEYGFADTAAVSIGIHGKKGLRNTPSAMNLSLQRIFFWDGRSRTLEEQALEPIANPIEMDLPVNEAVTRLCNDKNYNHHFRTLFNSKPTEALLAEAISSFERSLETSESPFDNWKFSDDPNAVSESVKRGFKVFNEKGKCIKCHFGADFTTSEFRNIGLFNGRELNDSGRISISGNKDDIGKFKTPGLRNVAITGPYMHNGMFRTLMEVIDFYNEPDKVVLNSINRDSILSKPLGLSNQEKTDIEAFLRSLTDKRFNKMLDTRY
jgi:cytochrome c peroxidase